jgi:hypothetical protein
METSVFIPIVIPLTLLVCKGSQFLVQHMTMIAGATQILYFVVDNI